RLRPHRPNPPHVASVSTARRQPAFALAGDGPRDGESAAAPCLLPPASSCSKLVITDGESKTCLNLHQAGFCSWYWILLCEAQESSADH
ncbi:unnamed protein product, partial [Urochloa humidicola]